MEEICVRPYHWEFEDKAVAGRDIQIRAWAMDSSSKPYLLRIEDFPVMCRIQLPRFVNGSITNWFKDCDFGSFYDFKVRKVYNTITSYLPDHIEVLPYDDRHFDYLKSLYDVQLPPANNQNNILEEIKKGNVGKFPILTLYFRNVESQRYVERKLKEPLKVFFRETKYDLLKLRVWETDVDPISKFLAFNNIRHCNWIKVQAYPVQDKDKISTLEKEYKILWQSLKKVEEEECKTWSTNPGIFSFDIECYSPNHRKFPDKWDPKCTAFMTSCDYVRADGSESISYTLVVGECPPSKKENSTVICVKTEFEKVKILAELIEKHDPEIITGFNIQGFDFDYLDCRLSQKLHDWPVMGRLKNVIGSLKFDNWESQAYSHNKIYHLMAPGRIVIDVFNVAKRENKFPEYNLNYVANYFLGTGKVKITVDEMFTAYELMQEAIKKGPGTDEYEKGMREMGRIRDYCEEDSNLCIKLFFKMNIWISSVEISNIMRINIYDLYTRGQQIRCFSQLYEACFKNGFFLDKKESEDIPFVGGLVQEPCQGLWDNTMTIDFQSLYPSIMEAYNICYSTYVPRTLWKVIPEEICNCIPVNCDSDIDPENNDEDDEFAFRSKGKKGVYEFRFIKEEYIRGLVPKLVSDLCNSRREVQKQMREEKTDYKIILNKRQEGLKVSANSFFGFLGVLKNGRRPFRQAAISITAWGRKLITETKDYVINQYGGKCIYGDTDSIMITIPQIKHPKECKYWIDKICQEVTALFPKAIIMKPEYCGRMFCIKKKKYKILLYDDDGNIKYNNGKPEVSSRGLLSVRRDNCKWARDTFETINDMIMFRKPLIDVILTLIDRVNMVIKGEIKHKDLLINRSVGSHYKSDNYFMKMFADEMRKIGKVIEPGERLWYLVTDKPEEEYLGKKMILEDLYIDSLETENPIKIDYLYYIEKVLKTHVDMIIRIAFLNDLYELMNYVQYTKPKSKTPIRIITPIALMCEMIRGGEDLDKLKEMMINNEHRLLK